MVETPRYVRQEEQAILVECPQCGKQIRTYEWTIADGRTGYCNSDECEELVAWEEV